MLAGNVLVIVRHGVSAAVRLNDPGLDHTVAQAASPVLERFAPILASRLATGDRKADQAGARGPGDHLRRVQ